MLIDGRGNRIEKGPTEIVRDNKQADGAVINGISCMSCHNRGLIEKTDQLREVVAKTWARQGGRRDRDGPVPAPGQDG